jgi:hypothetical protein
LDAPKPLKTGVVQGAGPPPGYQWSVGLLSFALDEATDCLTSAGYRHLEMQVKELATLDQPSNSPTVDVRPIEDFYEIRDKGGPLGNTNIRVFFGIDAPHRALIVLGVIKKQNSGKTPLGDKVRMRRRWRNYLAGDYGTLPR